jgi:hypothetical protein
MTAIKHFMDYSTIELQTTSPSTEENRDHLNGLACNFHPWIYLQVRQVHYCHFSRMS